MCLNMIRSAPEPTARAASMYGIATMESALDRTTRATRGMTGKVIATITLPVPGPSAATTAMAMTMSGNEMSTSMSRSITCSILPPKYALVTPKTSPSVEPTSDDVKPTSSAVRAPWMMRESRSRPNESVPRRCTPPGGSSAGPNAVGSNGAMRSASSAVRSITMMSAAPTAPSGRWRTNVPTARDHRFERGSSTYRRSAAVAVTSALRDTFARGSAPAAAVASRSRSRVPDPGIEDDVEHVHQEVHDHEDRGHEHDERLHERVVALLDREHDEAAQAVQVEDLLRHDEPADEERELEADDGHDGEQRVPQRVAHDDRRLAYTLRARRSDVVLAQDLEHRGPRHAHGDRRVAVPDRERGPDELRQVRDRVLPDRRERERGRPLECLQEHEDDEHPDPERRHRDPADAKDADRVVDPGVLPHRRHDAERDREQDAEERGEKRELDGQSDAQHHLMHDRLPGPERDAEVEAREIAHPVRELDVHRLVEAEGRALTVDDLLGHRGPRIAQRDDVAGDQTHDHEGEDRDADERRDHEEEPAEDVALHR